MLHLGALDLRQLCFEVDRLLAHPLIVVVENSAPLAASPLLKDSLFQQFGPHCQLLNL